MIGVGFVGYGYWGPNLVRNFVDQPSATAVAVCDGRESRLALVRKRHPQIATTTDFNDLLRQPGVDAVVIATPANTHFDLAWRALQHGKHVLVEKPLASTSEECARLMDEAARRRLVLMVDHTFVYTGAVRKMHELVSSGQLGEIYYYDSVRVNLGLFQHDVNVLWDLAVHDLSILDRLIATPVSAVSATGMSHVPGRPENIAYLTLFFECNTIGHIHVNWLAPVKIRQTLLGASERMLVYNDLDTVHKLMVYDKGITLNSNANPEVLYQALVGYRTGDMWAPKVDDVEALAVEARHFLSCVEKQEEPITGGQTGLRVVRILEAASRSMREHGRPIELRQGTIAASA